MEQEKLRWPKGDTVVLYTNPDTIIIISEFLEADG